MLTGLLFGESVSSSFGLWAFPQLAMIAPHYFSLIVLMYVYTKST